MLLCGHLHEDDFLHQAFFHPLGLTQIAVTPHDLSSVVVSAPSRDGVWPLIDLIFFFVVDFNKMEVDYLVCGERMDSSDVVSTDGLVHHMSQFKDFPTVEEVIRGDLLRWKVIGHDRLGGPLVAGLPSGHADLVFGLNILSHFCVLRRGFEEEVAV